MKRAVILRFLGGLALGASFFLQPQGASAGAEGIFYGTGQWNADAYGNHRAVVLVASPADAVWVHIPWRRRDLDPQNKSILVIDAATGERLRNVFRARIRREAGDLVFQPRTTPGKYHVYFLPYVSTGSPHYPKVSYPAWEESADSGWLAAHGLKSPLPPSRRKRFPEAQLIEIQSLDDFNSFAPMEVIATPAEVALLLKKHPLEEFLVFPEERNFPIRLSGDLPLKWKAGPADTFKAVASPGEFFVFQLGVYAARASLSGLDVRFSDLLDAGGAAAVAAEAFRAFNVEGVDWQGRRWRRPVEAKLGSVLPIWAGVALPATLAPGEYTAEAIVTAIGKKEKKVRIRLNIRGNAIRSSGDDEPWRLSRLRWLDSQLGSDDSVIQPFTPLVVSGRTLSCLGRTVALGIEGLPEAITSFFHSDLTRLSPQGRQVLSAPVRLAARPGTSFTANLHPMAMTSEAEGAVAWQSRGEMGLFSVECQGRLECDGCLEYAIVLTAARKGEVDDICLEIPLRREAARYMMGLGYKGGYRPQRYQWKWDQSKNQDALWIGDVNAGMQLSLRGENYVRPLNTNFYLQKPLQLPPSWSNQGRGGLMISEPDSRTVLLSAFSGPRQVEAGDRLHFNFILLLTPFKTLDTAGQWSTRYYHDFKPLEEVESTGANTVNVHHATAINPYINYPFLRVQEMQQYVEEAHRRGMKVKIYYTVRELSNRAPELFAFFSLGEEIFAPGPGGGFSWLQEHLNGNYIPGWVVPELKDAALITSGVSRFHNFYVEGLAWLIEKVGIDGLYIDDVAFDRSVMKRVRRVLDRGRPGALIDLHSANQFNVRDGFASSANLYLEHFPYLNRIWFGEYFDYDSPPDYWLVEISGIPFGVMGEMLQNGGNPWRGMLYGMTSRLPWSGDPRPLWKAWDDFGIQQSQMVGYWVDGAPVHTDQPDILATAYVRKERTMIVLASWAKEKKDVTLTIDGSALGLGLKRSVLRAPAIQDFQPAAQFKTRQAIPVEPGKGWILILEEKR